MVFHFEFVKHIFKMSTIRIHINSTKTILHFHAPHCAVLEKSAFKVMFVTVLTVQI
jgi:hypothetical protein